MMWAWQLYLGAAAFALVPVVNALTTHAHLGNTLRNVDWVLAGFDLSMIAFGAMLALGRKCCQICSPARLTARGDCDGHRAGSAWRHRLSARAKRRARRW